MVRMSRKSIRNRRRSRVGGASEESLYNAIRNNNIDKIEEILANNPNATTEENPDGALPLHYAALYNINHDILAKILNANPEAAQKTDNNAEYPIHYAAKCDDGENPLNHNLNLRMLYHANTPGTWQKNKDGESPLKLALIWSNFPSAIAFLYIGEFVLNSSGDSSESNVNNVLKETGQLLIQLSKT